MTQPAVTALGRHRFYLTDATGSRVAFAAIDGARTWVFIDGHAYVVEAAAERLRGSGSQSDDRGALTSPMPATVTGVRTSAGARVARGDVLVTLEAMKMELPVVAPRDGVVRAVLCRPGDLVQAGAPLVDLS